MASATIYIDTNIFIYLFEQHDVYSQQVADVLQEYAAAGASFLTSAITVTEFLAGTVSADLNTLRKVPRLQFSVFDESLAERAANLQRENNLQIGDAIHLATALEYGRSGTFFTNDKHLAKIAKQHILVRQL